MLQILRSVRRALVKRGELARYALYAVGQVVLVVVGILIALQVNNWNESRQSERERERILENLRADLVQEMDEFRYFIGLLEERERNTEYVLEILEDPPPEIDTAEAVENIVKVGWILVYEPTLATYNEIQSSGRLSLLDADTLKKRLAEYRAQIIDLNGINRTYDAGLKEYERMAIAYLSKIPPAQDGSAVTREANRQIRVDRSGMASNQQLVDRVRHITYHTRIQIASTEGLLLPIAEDLVNLIDERLGAAR